MTGRLDIDSYFMDISRVVASRSTCLRRQIGAVIVEGKQIARQILSLISVMHHVPRTKVGSRD